MPFYVAVDHDHQAVVVSIRGSLSMQVRNETLFVRIVLKVSILLKGGKRPICPTPAKYQLVLGKNLWSKAYHVATESSILVKKGTKQRGVIL